ncbi:MAG TPA: DNA primase, partial [Mycobacteriales bacterium]|nr:DNA primase [Mycobacteriales bacterium]
VDQVVSARVTLSRAGGGSLKGLCPFHDEKSPSFNVNPGRGVWYCFGCGAGGDAIKFVMDTELLSFTEAVEWLANRAGVQLTYEQAGPAPVRQSGQRQRLVAAHAAAAEFYAEQLGSPDARTARQFLAERGFDQQAAVSYGCGFAPDGWDGLTKHLRGRGFTEAELVTGGLSKESRRGTLIDRFRRRLLWPIRDVSGDVIGFGARKLFDDDEGPKYLNTPETPLYKKSTVLYGLDRAKRDIAKQHRAVVVEGYTDVMACHLAGVTTAVATCGTAFGGEHIGVLRRLLMDQDEFRGEVIFTFDGDAAGQKAALRAFSDDQRFVAQTFVAVESSGMDPCELRLAHGDAAVRDLVARREPLVAFALRSMLSKYDLDTAEGQVAALRAAAPLVAQIKDHALRPQYARRLAGNLGMEVEPVLRAVGQAGRNPAKPASRSDRFAPAPAEASGPIRPVRPNPEDPVLGAERESLKLAVQQPVLAGPLFDAVEETAYTHPAYVALRRAVAAAGGAIAGTSGPEWIDTLAAACDDPAARAVLPELAVEPFRSDGEPDPRYAGQVLARLQELGVGRQIATVKGRLQRLNPVEKPEEHSRLFGELVGLEQHKRALRDQAIGAL